MLSNDNPRCAACRDREQVSWCMPVEQSRLAAALGVQVYQCERCGERYAVRPERIKEIAR